MDAETSAVVDRIKELKFDAEVEMLAILRRLNMLHPRPSRCHSCDVPLVERDEETLSCPVCLSSYIVKGPYLMLYCPYIPLHMDAGVYDSGRTFGDYGAWLAWRRASFQGGTTEANRMP